MRARQRYDPVSLPHQNRVQCPARPPEGYTLPTSTFTIKMKFAIIFVAIVAVACAGLQKPLDSNMAELEAIVAAIQSPSTDPATAALLEQQLADLLAEFFPQPEPIFVEEPSPVHVGLPILDFPLPDGGAVSPVQPEAPALVPAPIVNPTPAAVAEAAAPLVQIILNINQASSGAAPVAPAPVETPVIDVQPVQVVDEAVNEETFVPTPVVVVDSAPEPVQVVDVVPAPAPEVEPIQIGSPIIPIPVVNIPIDLNSETMKLLLTVVALAAFAHGAPTSSQTMEIGANGVSGSVLNIPLVEIIVNMIKNEAAVVPGTVNEPVLEAEPVLVVDEAQLPTPVIVVDQPEVNPIDVISVNPMPAPAPVEENPIPEPVVLPAPAPAEVVPGPVVPEPVVLPEPAPAEVVPEPVVLPEPAPAEVVPNPTPVEVAPTPAEVVEVPAPDAGAAEGSSQIINVMLNFIFGASGSLSSVEVPANIIPQVIGAPRV
ncbi:calphotin-like [Cydia pomonella]|uniref:calphotin-like n=1 Tax=Cydia pomonella TaxID=82600 RepID=UPI002ADE748E|nr:calphotin-like [Cydia pomonella]